MNAMKNKVQLIGHLGTDPQIRNVNDKTIARFSVATGENYKNKKGEPVKETTWHNVVAWGKTAELADRLLTKGSEVAIEGKLSSHSYEDKSGNKKYITEVVAHSFILLRKKEGAAVQEA